MYPRIHLCLLFILFSFNSICADAENGITLSGKITDKQSGEVLAGVSVYLSDLKTGTVTNADGYYSISDLPAKKVLIQINYVGYKTVIETIDLSITTTFDFALEESVKEISEIVVTGLSHAAEKNRTPTPISIISHDQLQENAASNIIDAIASQPGVSQITTGAAISKPMIRGLGYNRVVVVNDEIRQEGQQWGDEHGIEIDEFSVYKVELLKGPASLSYGSDAMAGVIHLISAPSLPKGEIKANLLTNYQTNNGLIAYSANVMGNQRGFIWDLRLSNKMAHAYQNKYDGFVMNSAFKENALSGIIGLNKSWGYTRLQLSAYQIKLGIIEGERDSATGQFSKPIAINDSTESSELATETDFLSYNPTIPYQKVNHYKAVLNNSFYVVQGNLKLSLGFQQNQRQEFATTLDPNEYELYFLLNTLTYALSYNLPEKNNLSISFGTNGMYQTSQNKGEEFLIPDYNLFDIGFYSLFRKAYKKLDISGGIRFDKRLQNGKELYLDSLGQKTVEADSGSVHLFDAFSSQFSAFSGSLGMSYQFSESYYAKLNISRGFRAPNIAELGSNGEHEGSSRYEIGNVDLKAETSLEWDAAFGVNSEHITVECDVFANSISNFIYAVKLNSVYGGDSIIDANNPISTFKFTQGNAILYGGELVVDIHPHPWDWLHFENSISYVQSMQQNATDSTKYLPFTPAPKLESELRANGKKAGKVFENLFFKISVENYFAQNHVFSAFGTETPSPGYLLFNLGIGTSILVKKKQICSLYINANNITDVAYQSHLSRLKYLEPNQAIGKIGVYNMGRNISFKLIIPITLKKAK